MNLKYFSKIMLFFLLSLVFVSCNDTERLIPQSEAELIVTDYIENLALYRNNNGYNINAIDITVTPDNVYKMIYNFSVDSENLPSRVKGFEVNLYLVGENIRNATMVEIS